MVRSGLFWKTLLPSATLIVVTAFVAAADGLSFAERLLLLTALIVATTLHARWIAYRVTEEADSLADSVNRLGSTDSDVHWRDGRPTEVSSLVRSVADLESRLTKRIEELDSLSRKYGESTALLRAVLSTMVEGVVVLDNDQRILFANDAARPLLDFQTAEVLHRPLWEVARLVPVNQLVEGVLESGQQTSAEYEIPRTKRTVAVTADALPRKPVPGAMLVLHDVTELRRLERMRRDFVSNVSHELKTPLTSIQAYADTLLEGGFDDVEKDRHFLQKIVQQSERLAELILDIIRLGKIESDPKVFDVRPVKLAPVISACVDAHATVAQSEGVTLQSGPIDGDVAVMADPDELRTILDNLLDNALNYTPASGRVAVSVVRGEDELLGIEVADTGIGIPKDQQSRIFERFYRVDRARDRQRGGTGLGLSIVKHLSQLFGGRVDVQSEMGVGTRFTVWLGEAHGGAEAVEPGDEEPSHNLNIGSLTS